MVVVLLEAYFIKDDDVNKGDQSDMKVIKVKAATARISK